MHTIGHHLASRRWLDPSEVSQHLFQSLSICLWCANAQMWLSHFPPLPSDVDGQI